jgi:hypothetical protein
MSLRSALATFALGLLLLGTSVGRAEPLDASSDAALRETLRALQGGAGTKAPGADPRLGSVASSSDLYEVAGEVFRELTERHGGDPAKMSAALERAKKDPEGFAASLSPSTRARLKALADKVPAAE